MRYLLTITICVLGLGCSDGAIDQEETTQVPSTSDGLNPENPANTGPAALPELTETSTDPSMSTGPEGQGVEECDSLDNDADGKVDEGGCACQADAWCFIGTAAHRNVGVCKDGRQQCEGGGEFVGACVDSVGPSDELCDEEDDDCDGIVDEGCCENDPSCEGVEETFLVGEETSVRPVDFIMAIDNSGSMRDTVNQVEANLGTFSTRLVDAGIDYRFTLISDDASAPKCVCRRPWAVPIAVIRNVFSIWISGWVAIQLSMTFYNVQRGVVTIDPVISLRDCEPVHSSNTSSSPMMRPAYPGRVSKRVTVLKAIRISYFIVSLG